MLHFLPAPIKGALAFVLIVLNTVFWSALLFPTAVLKLIPIPPFRRLVDSALIWISTNWISCNNLIIALLNRIEWDVEGLEGLSMDDWYMVLSNHQSWTDILVLQRTFNRRVPFLKFFLKQELIWVPILGLAWWALDYPFMKRYTKEEIEKDPSKKGKDLETTREACEKFKNIPVSVMNFVEGTRFTQSKHDKQQSPHRHLLKPKAAGIAFVLAAMGEQLHYILDVSIVYPDPGVSLWGFLGGRVRRIKVRVRTIPITEELLGDYFEDAEYREKFQNWLNGLWEEKDQLIESVLAEG